MEIFARFPWWIIVIKEERKQENKKKIDGRKDIKLKRFVFYGVSRNWEDNWWPVKCEWDEFETFFIIMDTRKI